METRRLGRTAHESSVAILGGAAFWNATLESAKSAFDKAIAAGVNHLDVAPQYGEAQRLLGPHIPAVRDRLFVGCKTLRHDAGGVRAQFEESLELLHCERFDLYQMHTVGDLEELDRRADAMRAITAARDEGLCRFIGITGHNMEAPATHLEALRRYDLDTVMFPVNARLWADADYRRAAELLLEYAAGHDVGVMAIKAVAARPWDERERTSTTWYEPYVDLDSVSERVRFTLSVPGVQAFCTPGDVGALEVALGAAEAFVPLDAAARTATIERAAADANIFPMPTRS